MNMELISHRSSGRRSRHPYTVAILALSLAIFASLEAGRPFVLEAAGRRLEVRFEKGFGFAQLYSPPEAEFICFEPMTAPTNALSTGEDLPIVQAGEAFTARWSVRVIDQNRQ